jgi:3-deoxy-manno-octulosonate cytidylyltransferase (CMP-KDO synthetase)
MINNLSFAVVIPARYKSSRFPGKPLVDICGKPMIQHVWERCCDAVGQDKVYVATDDSRIAAVVNSFGGLVVLTSSECLTGTDRLAEVNTKLNMDFLINVQGDEPLIEPNDILTVINAYQNNPDVIINAMCAIKDESEFRSFNVPKVVVSKSNKLLYMSRAPIPTTKTNQFSFGYKQVCIYAFSRKHLQFFSVQGQKSPVEDVEDIEILRFLENNIEINMIEVSTSSIAVDVLDDVIKVINALG